MSSMNNHDLGFLRLTLSTKVLYKFLILDADGQEGHDNILTNPQTLKGNIHGTIDLPCHVNNPGKEDKERKFKAKILTLPNSHPMARVGVNFVVSQDQQENKNWFFSVKIDCLNMKI